MKTDWSHLEGWRVRNGLYRTGTGDDYGQFMVLLASGVTLCIIATSGATEHGDDALQDEREAGQWEHVSVHAQQPKLDGSTEQRTPTWGEMCEVKDLFWGAEETVMQLHPPKSEYVNTHNHVLHLWRPKEKEIPRPPRIAV